MKKVLLAAVLLVGTAVSSFAQKGGSNFSIGLEAGLPVGNASNAYSFVIGGSLKYEAPIATGTHFTLTAGYSSFQGKTIAGFKVPAWLYAVVIVMFAFYASFGFVPIAQMIFKGNYRTYEYTYLTLSLVSKASLGLLVAIGFGQRSSAANPS